jgi:N-methylhydantoinase A/oxoprolinase/acetone carboxylase beta subunit
MRLYGQAHQIAVPIPNGPLSAERLAEIQAAFEQQYRQLYKRTTPGVAVEAISWRVVVSGPRPALSLRRAGAVGGATVKGERPAYFPETDFTTTPVYDCYALTPGARFAGPAIVEERESTAIIGPGAEVEVDAHSNLVITLPS